MLVFNELREEIVASSVDGVIILFSHWSIHNLNFLANMSVIIRIVVVPAAFTGKLPGYAFLVILLSFLHTQRLFLQSTASWTAGSTPNQLSLSNNTGVLKRDILVRAVGRRVALKLNSDLQHQPSVSQVQVFFINFATNLNQ